MKFLWLVCVALNSAAGVLNLLSGRTVAGGLFLVAATMWGVAGLTWRPR